MNAMVQDIFTQNIPLRRFCLSCGEIIMLVEAHGNVLNIIHQIYINLNFEFDKLNIWEICFSLICIFIKEEFHLLLIIEKHTDTQINTFNL